MSATNTSTTTSTTTTTAAAVAVVKSLTPTKVGECLRKARRTRTSKRRKLNAEEIIQLHLQAHELGGMIRPLNADEVFDLRTNGSFQCDDCSDYDGVKVVSSSSSKEGEGRVMNARELLRMYNAMQTANPTVIRELNQDELFDLAFNDNYHTY